MKVLMVSLMVLMAAAVGRPQLVQGQEQQSNADLARLHALLQQTRAELAALRTQAGLSSDRGEAREGGREEGERGERGHAEGGERGEGGHDEGREEGGRDEGGEGGEESGTTWGKSETSDMVYNNGARLILAYNAETQAFEGSVRNTTRETLSQVRVEIHLNSGVELGPTQRVDLEPGATLPVALSAIGYEFSSWVTHPEAGVEEGHGSEGEEGGEGREGGHDEGGEGREGGEGAGDRPRDGALRPLYNQIQLLRGEIRSLSMALQSRGG